MTVTVSTDLPWRWQHYQLYGPVISAKILGQPVPQGSIRSLGKGRPSIHSNAARLLPWREHVQLAIEDAIDLEHRVGGLFPIVGPVAVDVTFTMPKPKSAPKTRRTFPTTRPDLDKILRALGDALQNAGALKDDSQIVQWGARKVFPLEAPQSLATPGAYLFVYAVESGVLLPLTGTP